MNIRWWFDFSLSNVVWSNWYRHISHLGWFCLTSDTQLRTLFRRFDFFEGLQGDLKSPYVLPCRTFTLDSFGIHLWQNRLRSMRKRWALKINSNRTELHAWVEKKETIDFFWGSWIRLLDTLWQTVEQRDKRTGRPYFSLSFVI